MNRNIINTAAGVLLLIGSASAAAWALDGPQDSGKRMGPPPEAIEACKDKSEGAAVEFTGPRGEKIKATCKQIEGQLAAVPDGGFRGPKAPPPGGE
ncbi:MAG: hypothetical protein WC581_06030 [Thermodesulfovibrionales bacterium]